ncbi:MAG TPA: hypothetical protein DIU15_16345, partial [Deltaproteobacteria bacterium]|nr:hypothetical protein [Deltaproteobacteria bacterium]
DDDDEEDEWWNDGGGSGGVEEGLSASCDCRSADSRRANESVALGLLMLMGLRRRWPKDTHRL